MQSFIEAKDFSKENLQRAIAALPKELIEKEDQFFLKNSKYLKLAH